MGRKILVVDDEKPIRELLRMKLSREGYEVLTAGSRQEFLTYAMLGKPDLIILDIWLRESIGPEVYYELTERGFYQDVPVIFITALVPGYRGTDGMPAGEKYSLFSKPFDFRKLIKEVRGLLSQETGA